MRFTGDLRYGPCAEEFQSQGRLRLRLHPGGAVLLAPAPWPVPRSLPLLRGPTALITALWTQQL